MHTILYSFCISSFLPVPSMTAWKQKKSILRATEWIKKVWTNYRSTNIMDTSFMKYCRCGPSNITDINTKPFKFSLIPRSVLLWVSHLMSPVANKSEMTILLRCCYSAFFITLVCPFSAHGEMSNCSPITFLHRKKTNWNWILWWKCRRKKNSNKRKELVLNHVKQCICFCANMYLDH